MWSFQINIKTLEIETNSDEYDDGSDDFLSQNPFLLDGRPFNRADYEEWDEDIVYAESNRSAKHAKQLAYDLCLALSSRFSNAVNAIYKKGI